MKLQIGSISTMAGNITHILTTRLGLAMVVSSPAAMFTACSKTIAQGRTLREKGPKR